MKPRCLRSEIGKDSECLLFDVGQGRLIETVYFSPAPGANDDAICLSVSAGCVLAIRKQACVMCATGTALRFEGNLDSQTLSHILFYVIDSRRSTPDSVLRINFSGEGEPLYNLEAIIAVMHQTQIRYGCAAPHFLVSTVGVAPNIPRLAQWMVVENDPRNLFLQVSLHGLNDACRSHFVPLARIYDLQSIGAACTSYMHILRSDERFLANTSPLYSTRIRLNFLPLADAAGWNFSPDSLRDDFNRLAAWFPVEDCAFVVSEWNPIQTSQPLEPVRDAAALAALEEAAAEAGFYVKRFRSRGADDGLGGCGTLVPSAGS